MIDVQKCALRAFKEDFFPALKGAMKIHNGVADKWAQPFSRGQITLVDFAKTDRSCAGLCGPLCLRSPDQSRVSSSHFSPGPDATRVVRRSGGDKEEPNGRNR